MKIQLFLAVACSLLSSCAGSGPYVRLESALGMERFEGKKVELTGCISQTPWQHLTANPESFGYSYYFDVADYQIVVYAKAPIACTGSLTVRGTVIKVQGSSKKPGVKADESFVEYHLAADAWECGEKSTTDDRG
jgi:hypothetical protein